MKKLLLTILFLFLLLEINAQVIDLEHPSIYNGFYNTQQSSTIGTPQLITSIVVRNPSSNQINLFDSSSDFISGDLFNPEFPRIQEPITTFVSPSGIVGEIPITSEVTPTGAMSYIVPIEIIPGLNGLQPNISIVYNSQRSNGILGAGWGLSGLSSISRSDFSFYHDGKTSGLTMDKSCPITLDGMRLIKISETATTIEYITEQGNVKIVGTLSGVIIKYFKVFYPNGMIGIFGYETNTTAQLSYPITKMSDTYGNYITFTYTSRNEHYYATTISYGASATTSHFASINISYKTRNDVSNIYVVGKLITEDYLIDKITCNSGSTVMRTYTMEYETQSYVNTTLLTQIKCNISGNELSPLEFHYGTGTQTSRFESETASISETFSSSYENDLIVLKGKFDYTSKDDGLIIYPNSKNGYNPNSNILMYKSFVANGLTLDPYKITMGDGFTQMFVANIDGQYEDEVIKVNNRTSFPLNNKIIFTIYKPTTYSFTEAYNTTFTFPSIFTPYCYPGDLNGDGKSEVFIISKSPTKCHLVDLENKSKLYEGSVFDFKDGDVIFLADYDGDGKADIFHLNSNGLDIYTFNISGSTYSLEKIGNQYTGLNVGLLTDQKLLLGDVNGDGKTDMMLSPLTSKWMTWNEYFPMATHHHCPNCYERAPGTSVCKYCSYNLGECQHCYDCGAPLDANGCCSYCGCYRIIPCSTYYSRGNNWRVMLSKGNGDFVTKNVPLMDRDPLDGYMLHDVNGDGTWDFVRRDNNRRLSVHLIKNGIINPIAEASTISLSGYGRMIPSDVITAQYHNEILNLHNYTLKKIRFSRDDGKQQLLTKAVNSLGVTTTTYYEYLYQGKNNPSHYSIGARENNFPYQSFWGPICVVTGADTRGNGFEQSLDYKYKNAIIHKQGLGFRGFSEIKTIDNKRNLPDNTVTRTYDPCKWGVLLEEESTAANAQYEYNVAIQTNKKLDLSIKKKIVTDKLKGVTTTANYTYGGYNLMTKEDIDHLSNGTIKTTTNFTYNNIVSASSYVIGLPLTKTIQSSRNGVAWESRETISYNTNNSPITKIQYVQNNKVAETQWTYDAVGNRLTEKSLPYSSSDWLETQYTYSTNKRFLTKEVNPMGLATEYTYDQTKCLLLTSKDHKSNLTSYAYDGLGRLTKTTNPDGTIEECKWNWATTDGQTYYTTITKTGAPTAKTYYDGLGREVLSNVIGFDGAEVNTSIVYDMLGRVEKKSDPYKGAATPQYTTYSYDAFNRVTKSVAPSGKQITHTYSNNTITENNAGLSTTRTCDALGNPVTITDPAGTITYTYRPDGQPLSIKAPDNATTSFEYDAYGRQTKITDPSAGVQTYTYDAAGNLKTQTNANGKTITITCNKFGQEVKRVTPEFTIVYNYTPDYMLSSAIANNGTSFAYTYDNLGRMATETETVDNNTLTKTYTYSSGKIASVAYNISPAVTLNYVYNTYGYLAEKKLGTTSIWKATQVNARGQVESATLGNGAVVARTYTAQGLPLTIKATKGTTALQNFSYIFDAQKGLLTSRTDAARSKTEAFTYDNLLRLKTYGSSTVTYNNMGNITAKTDAGTMAYLYFGKPYAMTSLTGNAGTVPQRLQEIAYTSFSRPATIAENDYKAELTYNPANDRIKMRILLNNTLQYTRYYLGGCYEKETNAAGTVQSEFLYVGGTPYNAPAVYSKEGSVWKLYYLHRDYLGSITQISDAAGAAVAEYSYDAWGRLRNPATQTAYLPGQEPALKFNRGYTGHEHLPLFGLINMNARLYDPVLGRFLAPDPYVQAPGWSQNFNRYTYAMNNPLVYTDESGEVWWLVPAILAGVFATGNTVAHAIRGDIRDIGDFLKYSSQGAITGFALGCAWQFTGASYLAGMAPWIQTTGSILHTSMSVYAYTQAGITTAGLIGGAIQGGWDGLARAGKIALGNFYLDENNFFGGALQGFTRHSWEMLQTAAGHGFIQTRNMASKVTDVEYFGGAVFAINADSDKHEGGSLSNFIKMNDKNYRKDKNSFFRNGKFTPTNDLLYMHEYGHTFDSQLFGISYLFAIGIPSATGADWTEIRANKHAARYFKNHFGYEWPTDNSKYPLK